MRKILIVIFIILGALELIFALSMAVKASSPTLSISVVSNDAVQLTGYGDANAPVVLYYPNHQNTIQSQYITSTNSNGYFSIVLSRYAYNINPGSYVYVVVNNQQSSSVIWPYGSGLSNVSLSQTNLTLNPGQSQTVTIYGGGNYYISINSNSGIASAAINGNTINVTGNTPGSTNLTICQNYGQCAVLYVSVSAYQYNYWYSNQYLTPITFSQTNLNMGINQTVNVTISGGSGSYFLDYISDENSLDGDINNKTLTLTSRSAISRNIVVVCSSSHNNCAALTVIVGGSGYDSYDQGWSYCASENQYCSFSGTRTVRYGANGKYYYKTFSNGVSCSNYIFSDPIFGIVKQCSISQ